MRKFLVSIEGPDNTGKSTIVEKLVSKFGAKHIVQPTGHGPLGFLRDIVKNNKEIDPFPRQLLHTCSHIYDILQQFDGSNIIMDRCHLSALVYGNIQGLTELEENLILNIHRELYKRVINDLGYTPIIILIDQNKPFTGPDDSVYESLEWDLVRKKYLEYYERFLEKDNYLFHPREDIGLFNRDITTGGLYELIHEFITHR